MSDDKVTAFYIRTANKEEGSVEFQKERLTKYCRIKEIKNYEFYIDEGYSGNNMERPALQKLIKDALENKISNCVICDLGRFSRSSKKAFHIIYDIFIPNNVDIISLVESFDSSTPVGEYILENYAMLEAELGKRVKELCQGIKK